MLAPFHLYPLAFCTCPNLTDGTETGKNLNIINKQNLFLKHTAVFTKVQNTYIIHIVNVYISFIILRECEVLIIPWF